MFLYIVGATSLLLYLVYRLVFGTTYRPGSVARFEADSPDSFDNPALLAATSAQFWRMPNGISLFYEASLSSTAAAVEVLCLHGGPAVAPARPWRMCSEKELLERVSFYSYHQRGCGRSSRPFTVFPGASFWPGCQHLEGSLGLGAQVADIERVRRRLGVDRIALVGHSFGGFVALLYAAEFPERVSALVLVAPASMLRIPQPSESDLFNAIRTKLPSEDLRTNFDNFKTRYFKFSQLPEMDERDAATLHREFLRHFRLAFPNMYYPDEGPEESVGGWAAFASYLSLGMRYDLRPELKKRLRSANFQVAIVSGKQDVNPYGEYEEFIKLFPRGTARWFSIDGGHFLLDEKPEVVKEILLQTLP